MQGEGEVKILSRVLRPWADVLPEDDHAVVALDSDMALMALMMPNPNVYVLAEPARYSPMMSYQMYTFSNTCPCSPRMPNLHLPDTARSMAEEARCKA